jgi:UDP-3-O-[3-hydroxymyristoyl] glucosamine N-acyltransferase
MGVTLGELAARVGSAIQGDPATLIDGVGTLQNATPGQIAFLANPRYRRHLEQTRAAAVILGPEDASASPVPALIADNPYLTYARVAAIVRPPAPPRSGIHETAVVADDAVVAADAWVGPCAVIESGARVDAAAQIGPGSTIGRDAIVGRDTRLVARVSLCDGVRVGARCLLHPGVVIGADGFGVAKDGASWVKVPQLGGVVIGDDVEVGANTTIDRGAIDETVIGDGVKLDNQIQVGHNVVIGEHTVIAGCVGISGSAIIGRRCMIGGQVGIAGHLEIADDVVVTGQTLVASSIREPGVYSSALTMDDARTWRRNAARFRQLDDMARRLRRLEKQSERQKGDRGDG